MKKVHLLLTAALLVPFLSFAADSAHSGHGSASESSSSQQAYMKGMDAMHTEMMEGLKSSDPDIAFAKGMIAHHRGAIDMAKTELQYGKDPELRKLAEEIIKAQQPEIDQMEAWLKKQGKQ
ncbi:MULTISPECIES: DUF305 domain-containing protein [Pectobacterium]|uniref:DUF305 domain-containing protein n=1 Tax=Pectobacterium carotovorum subsp. carotovorum (strain PC1) TaxID=561230 RepID=C6DKF9_PECCP|nr:DUF305 domain-containing protein [Pectobacterium carotovorum]ACT11596.1 protein of unknown function DUF305 [Pectobacterium carotovorum subsp. carotovorum PC1]